MKLITDLNENKWHDNKGNGSYEWWYFDAIDHKCEYSFVAIFLTGNPFSPNYTKSVKEHIKYPQIKKPDPLNFSAVSFNLYYKNSVAFRILYEYKKNKFSQITNSGSVQIDRCIFEYDEKNKKYILSINIPSTDVQDKLRADFEFRVNIQSSDINNNSLLKSDGIHNWLPAAPNCEVSGKIRNYDGDRRKKSEFNGKGYHDHNWGNESMFANFSHWYWGRVITEEYTVIYFYIKYLNKEKSPFKKLMIFKNNKLISEKNDFKIQLNNSKNYWFLNYNKSAIIEADDIKLSVVNNINLDNGPFYIRFISEYDLHIKNELVFENKPGFSEYINPQRLKSGFLKPFVNLRIKRID